MAARAQGERVDARLIRAGVEIWNDHCDFVLVEGVGGLMSPISDVDLVANVAADFGYPLLVVAANVLGTINQTLQTLVAAESFGLEVTGVVLNDVTGRDDASTASNRTEIERLASVPVVAQVEHGATSIHLDRPIV